MKKNVVTFVWDLNEAIIILQQLLHLKVWVLCAIRTTSDLSDPGDGDRDALARVHVGARYRQRHRV